MLVVGIIRVPLAPQEVLQGAFREGLRVGCIVGVGQHVCKSMLMSGHLHAGLMYHSLSILPG